MPPIRFGAFLMPHPPEEQFAIARRVDALGFDSPFHLSADFKARTGVSPTEWRSRIAARTDQALDRTAEAAGVAGGQRRVLRRGNAGA